MRFKDCYIVVKSEADKREFLRACQHIHDFTVFFDKNKKITTVKDQWSQGRIKTRELRTKGKHPDCGVCLNFDKYPFINFLAGLWDCENERLRDRYFIIGSKLKLHQVKSKKRSSK